MDRKSMRSSSSSSQIDEDYSSSRKEVADDHEEGPLPGFRFHPTDEELVSFYLKRKIEKRPLSIEIIKHMDIYKHDPWDLPKASSSVGDKEWYFYCKRGRKYRNSVRPNRVTGSGFWKATGIDRPIYSNGGEGHQCVGLKKSLVYYRGSAGKGTKTDWMMHEFRLPTTHQPLNNDANSSAPKENNAFEAEIWTLCRIFKRNKRQSPDWKDLTARRNAVKSCSKSSSIDSNTNQECFISFATRPSTPNNNNLYYTSASNSNTNESNVNIGVQYNNNITSDDQKSVVQVQSVADYDGNRPQWNSLAHPTTTPATLNNAGMDYEYDLRGFYGSNWDDLNSIVEYAVRTTTPLL